MISEYVDKLAQAFEELGVDYSNMSAAEAKQSILTALKRPFITQTAIELQSRQRH